MALGIQEGEFLVKLSRETIKYYLENLVPPNPPKTEFSKLLEKQGIFCTLLTNPEDLLRGCIGIIKPEKSLIHGVMEASCCATEDPRFIPLNSEELEHVRIELTILGPLNKITIFEPRDYLNEIKIGEDGLYLEYKYNCSVFLPQVPVEQNWDIETYLSELCKKAGLPPDAWITKPINLFKFNAQIFSEEIPGGEIIEKKLAD